MGCPVILFFAFLGLVMATTALKILFKLLSLTTTILGEVRRNSHIKRQRENDHLRALPSTGPLHTPRGFLK